MEYTSGELAVHSSMFTFKKKKQQKTLFISYISVLILH